MDQLSSLVRAARADSKHALVSSWAAQEVLTRDVADTHHPPASAWSCTYMRQCQHVRREHLDFKGISKDIRDGHVVALEVQWRRRHMAEQGFHRAFAIERSGAARNNTLVALWLIGIRVGRDDGSLAFRQRADAHCLQHLEHLNMCNGHGCSHATQRAGCVV